MSDFNAWSITALWTLLEVTVAASICFVLILAVQRALGKQLRPTWRYAIWTVLLFRMLLPFSYEISIPYTVPLPQKASTVTIGPAPIAIPPTPATPRLETPAITQSVDSVTPTVDTETVSVPGPREVPFAPAVFIIWFAGALTVIGRVVVRHVHLARLIERDAAPAPDSVSHALRRVRDELGISMWPVALVTSAVASPTVVGALRPRVLLPKDLAESASPEGLRLILMHELIHVQRRDLFVAWLWLLALALHWFNPLMWWAGARMRRDREQACDQRVLAALAEGEHIAYGHTLLEAVAALNTKATFNRFAGTAAIVENEAELEDRLTMIRDYRPSRPRHKLTGAVSALALAGVAFTQVWVAAQEQEQRAPEPPAASPAQASQTTPPATATSPFDDITDEAKLVELRDQAAKADDVIRACAAEMRRVRLRAANGNAYKDKIDFSEVHRNLPPITSEGPAFEARIKAFEGITGPDSTDPDYLWRAYHLLSFVARDAKKDGLRESFLTAAIAMYPRTKYSEPSKHSKFQHLVNEAAMFVWDKHGVDAAENYVAQLWEIDRRFVYFYDQPWVERYKAESLPATRLAALKARLGEKPKHEQFTVLISPEGPRLGWSFYNPTGEKPNTGGKTTTWEAIEEEIKKVPNPSDYFIALGYTSEDMPFKTWRDAQTRCLDFVKRYGFDHFSDIGLQTPSQTSASASADTAPPVDPTDPIELAINAEINRHYFDTSPEVQEFLRSTAKSFGRSRLWLPESDFPDYAPEQKEERIAYLIKLFNEGTYGRHMCEGLTEASVLKSKLLVPGLMKVAAYHVDDKDYDCRPKWMAIAALARQEDERAVPVLVPLVDHGNLNTRMWAQAALARITDQSFGADKQAWANWWNGAGKKPELGPEAVKPYTPPKL